MKKVIHTMVLSAVAGTTVWAGGYKIPEQSLNSMALGAAYVAHTMGADSAYFNPANMVFLEDKQYIAGGVTLAHLPQIDYTLSTPVSGNSKEEDIIIPNMHYVSNAFNDFRWGVSFVVPGGLTKRWETPFQKAYAQEFTLKILELNPSLAYKVSEKMSVAMGVRVIYSEGIVKSNSADAHAINPAVASASRDMEGDTVAFGYNLAVTYKPTSDINVAMTYRSNVDLNEEGNAEITAEPYGVLYNGASSVEVPLPAALNVAISKTWGDKLTLEFNYERTFWSSYETLDFKYSGQGNEYVPAAFDQPLAKNWKDTNTFRVGATIKMDNKITFMTGFSIDETPVPAETIGFELPDSDAKIFSMGFNYQQTEQFSWGVAFLYDSKETRSLTSGEYIDSYSLLNNGGSFEGGGAYLTTLGMAYEF
jgi:long-chain fatty acid transport protein